MGARMQRPLILASFRPRLLDALRGYQRAHFLRDLGAGVTVGVVALPLAMAFAIASGLKPEAGLWTAIIAGLLVGITTAMSIQFAPAWSGAAVYVLMAAILLIRPRGLFGERWERFE